MDSGGEGTIFETGSEVPAFTVVERPAPGSHKKKA